MAGGHREDDVGRFRTYTGEGHQFQPRAVGRQLENPSETITATLLERSGDRGDSWRLLLRETRVPYRPCNLRLRGPCDSLLSDHPDPRLEVLESAAFVGDGLVVRQDCRDEDVDL